MPRRKVPLLKFIRRRLKGAEKKYKKSHPFIAQEARLVREAINTPHSSARFQNEFKKPLLDAPQQLKHKRIRPFIGTTIALTYELDPTSTKKHFR